MTKLTKAISSSMAVAVFAAASLVASPSVSALQTEPVQVSPICSIAALQTSYWTVLNKDTDDVDLYWNNVDNAVDGNFIAVNGTTQLDTYFNAADPNNRTEFTDETGTVSRNAQVRECNPGEVVITTPVTPVTPTNPTAPVEGGRGGGDTVVATPAAVPATPAAATLANTGASQMLPYSAALLIALFTIATTVATRKNLI